MITIKNLRGGIELSENDYYAGRYCKYRPDLKESPLANPFSKGTREENVADYYAWLEWRLNDPNSFIYKEMQMLLEWAKVKDLGLCCWCYPKLCHCNIIKNILEEMS